MSNMYRDSLHELVKPIIFGSPKSEKEKKEAIKELRKAARQEKVWAGSANLEGRAERARGLKLPKGDPMRMELISDSKIAFSFAKIRISRSKKLSELADRLKKELDKEKELKNKQKGN